MKKLIRVLAAISLVLICSCVGCVFFAQFLPESTATPIADFATALPTESIVNTAVADELPTVQLPTDVLEPTVTNVITVIAAKGVITVPGLAYLDGRETEVMEGLEPLTINKINVWKEHGPGFSPLVCDRPHGHPVKVLDTEYIEERNWFQVDAGDGCIGWLLDSLISPTLEPPIGELWTGE